MGSMHSLQVQWCCWQSVEPCQRPDNIFRDMGSSLSPEEGLGIELSQSLAFLEETARKRILSLFDCDDCNRFWNLNSFNGLCKLD